ncbi:MAG: hypothetical protein N2Z79_04180, partial [Candidatus Omnitrophica bacterium]|nr:hypothetical protein [Candidatus Omnitrophota bacterium]
MQKTMVSRKILGIIFDLGRVLIDFDHHLAARRAVEFSDKSEEEIFNLFFDSDLTGLFEEGKLSPSEFFLEAKQRLNLRLTYEQFLPIWNEIFYFTEENKKVLDLANLLKKRFRILLLSNINILHFEYLRQNFSFIFIPFPQIVLSFKVGVRKPHPLIYQIAQENLDLQMQEILEIDDRKELSEEAKNLELQVHHFR